MQSTSSRFRLATALLIAASLLVLEIAAPIGAGATHRGQIKIDHFLTGLACVESGGRYTAENRKSGAYGKYQIMPRNWIAWARRYLRDRWAEPTPQNQEYVARQRITDLYSKRGSWRRVAFWWRNGDGEPNEMLWSTGARKYVDRVMEVAHAAADEHKQLFLPERCFPGFFPPPDIRTEPRPRVEVTGGRVFVRRAAGYENRAVTTVRRGLRLAVLDKGRDPRGQRWLRIGMLDGRTGWVAAWFVEPLD